jgi:hypothetical protein
VRRGRAALGWGLFFFAGCQLALVVVMERWHAELRDREYGWKRVRLSARLAQEPARPLLLMLGSSRTLHGFQPERLDGTSGPGGRPFVAFNFGLTTAGPLKEGLCLRRLLDEGVRPTLLLVEVMAPFLNEPGPGRVSEEKWLNVPGLGAADVLRLRPYWSRPERLVGRWVLSRLVPAYTHRFRILDRLARSWLPPGTGPETLDRMDGAGWLPTDWDVVSPDFRHQCTEQEHELFASAFAGFRLGARPRQALCDLLECCRREEIPVTLVLMPEGTACRGWYTPSMEGALRLLLAELTRSYSARVIDARDWVADEHFYDSHHLLPSGAALFSARLAREVVRHVEP